MADSGGFGEGVPCPEGAGRQPLAASPTPDSVSSRPPSREPSHLPRRRMAGPRIKSGVTAVGADRVYPTHPAVAPSPSPHSVSPRPPSRGPFRTPSEWRDGPRVKPGVTAVGADRVYPTHPAVAHSPSPHSVSPRPPSRDSTATRRGKSRQWRDLSDFEGSENGPVDRFPRRRAMRAAPEWPPHGPREWRDGPRVKPGVTAVVGRHCASQLPIRPSPPRTIPVRSPNTSASPRSFPSRRPVPSHTARTLVPPASALRPPNLAPTPRSHPHPTPAPPPRRLPLCKSVLFASGTSSTPTYPREKSLRHDGPRLPALNGVATNGLRGGVGWVAGRCHPG
jgi:hypothetical protein